MYVCMHVGTYPSIYPSKMRSLNVKRKFKKYTSFKEKWENVIFENRQTGMEIFLSLMSWMS